LSLDIIVDGEISHENLKLANLDVNWLNDTLSKFGINNPKDVLLASLDSEGKLYYQLKERRNN